MDVTTMKEESADHCTIENMKRTLKIIALFLVVCMFMTACGGKSGADNSYYYDDEAYAPMPEPVPSMGGAAYDAKAEQSYDYYEAENGTYSDPNSQQGLILTFSASIDMETLDFEASMAALQEAISKAGGFISNQYRSGGYTSYNGSYIRQSAELQIKVPAAKFHEFVDSVNTVGNVRSVNTWQEDITSGYLDTKARLESLNAQKDRLIAMMDQAETVADLIQIEQQLSNTIYQIESYTSQMKVYQNLADYSTITVYLNEVSVVTSNPVTFGQRIIDTFKRTGRNIVRFGENLVLGLIEALPLIVFAVILFLIIRKAVKVYKAKKQREYDQWMAQQQAAQANQMLDQNNNQNTLQ